MKKIVIYSVLAMMLCSCADIDSSRYTSYDNAVVELRNSQTQALLQLAAVQEANAKAIAEIGKKDGTAGAFAALALSVGNRPMADAVNKLIEQAAPDLPAPAAETLGGKAIDAVSGAVIPAFGYMAIKSVAKEARNNYAETNLESNNTTETTTTETTTTTK